MRDINDQIKAWLKANGKDRQWLADQLNTKKSVVDSWFSSRGFPSDRLEAILFLMKGDESTSLIRVPFTDQQLENTHRAAQLVNAELQEYCQRAIETQVDMDLGQARHRPHEGNANGTTGP